MSERHPIALDDFWELKNVTDLAVSPTENIAAYVLSTNDKKTNSTRTSIWKIDLETSESSQFTTGDMSDVQPRFSPDGAQLALVSSRHEHKPQIFLMGVHGGEPRRLTNAKDGAHSPVWSPDGTRICFASDVESERQKVPQEAAWLESHSESATDIPRMRRVTSLFSRLDGRGYIDRRSHLFVIDIDAPDSEPRQFTDGDFDHVGAAWSPDGDLIAFAAHRGENTEFDAASDLWTVDVSSGHRSLALQGVPSSHRSRHGELKALTSGDVSLQSPVWSPDGRKIVAYGSWEMVKHGYNDTHLWMVSRDGGDARDVSANLDRPFRFVQPDMMFPTGGLPTWSPDGKTIFFTLLDHGDSAIFSLDESGTVHRLLIQHANVLVVQCTPDGQSLVCVASTPSVPFELFTVPASGGELRPLTGHNRELLESVTVAPSVRLEFSGPDDWKIEGWLVRPPQSTAPCPLILHVHGGPQGTWGNTFYLQAQALAGAGYASLYVNPRGSLGYGEAFSRAADWGEKDFRDLVAGLDAAIALGGIDPEAVGITGISYGGFMTNWALGNSDRFAAGVSVNGVSSHFTMFGVSDVSALWLGTLFGGSYFDSEEIYQVYRHHSPLTHVQNITAPLLLLHAEDDYRCPIDQSEQMLVALRMRKQTVELIRSPGATHTGVAQPHQRLMQWRLSKDWFDQFLRHEAPEMAAAEIGAEPVTVA